MFCSLSILYWKCILAAINLTILQNFLQFFCAEKHFGRNKSDQISNDDWAPVRKKIIGRKISDHLADICWAPVLLESVLKASSEMFQLSSDSQIKLKIVRYAGILIIELFFFLLRHRGIGLKLSAKFIMFLGTRFPGSRTFSTSGLHGVKSIANTLKTIHITWGRCLKVKLQFLFRSMLGQAPVWSVYRHGERGPPSV